MENQNKVDLREVNHRSRGWIFTIYARIDEDDKQTIGHEQVEQAFRSIDPKCDFDFQLEEGEQDHRLHYQATLMCSRSVKPRRKDVIAHMKRFGIPDAWCAPVKKADLAEKYCSKLRTRIAGPWFSSDDFRRQIDSLRTSKQGKRTDLTAIRSGIDAGQTVDEMVIAGTITSEQQAVFAERLFQAVNARTWSSIERSLSVHYLFGATGTGKTRYVYRHYGADQIFTANMTARDPFDGYRFQHILVLDEFRSQVPISTILQMLDRYPYSIDRRYRNTWAAWTTVFITSNWRLDEQYLHEQSVDRKAFFRRITDVMAFPTVQEPNGKRDLFTGKRLETPTISNIKEDEDEGLFGCAD